MLKQSVALFGLCATFSANAAILSINSEFGFDTVTRDTSSGLDWLDVTESIGLSYNQVVSQMGIGGTYEGWRYASIEELDQLITNFGYVAMTTGCRSPSLHCDSISGDSEIIEQMITLLGDTYAAYSGGANISPDGVGYTNGILGSAFPNYDDYYTFAVIEDSEYINYDVDDQVFSMYSGIDSDSAGAWRGSFLVRTSPIPIPAAAWLFGSALVGLAGMKRRK